jgi:outer membrane protein assembly factor BamB
MMMVRKLIGIVGVLALTTRTVAVPAGDFSTERNHNWHQWRGPEATGVAPHANPPVEWDQSRNLKWKAAIPGQGKSTPIVWGHRIFVTTAINTGTVVEGAARPEDQPQRQFGIKFPNTLYRFVVQCLDRQTGKLLWEQTAVEALPHEGHHGDNSFASASPTTDGQFLYVSFGSRGVYCYDLDGHRQWQRKLNNVSTRLSFGEGSSPVIHGDTVLLVRDNETDSRILALDARTGESRWERPREESSAWATPLVVEHNGRTQVITNASKRVRSYDLQTGDVIWECGGQVANVTPCPVLLGEQVICMSGYRGSIAMSLPIAAEGDITDSPRIAWRYSQDTPYVPSPLLYGDLLYFNKLNNGVLTVLDAKTGQPVLEATRLQGISNVYASPVGAADRVYYTSRDGTTVVLKHGSKLELLATNRIDDLMDASPAIVGNQIFIRGQNALYCFQNP